MVKVGDADRVRNEIRRYYQGVDLEKLFLPNRSTWRHFRFQSIKPDGTLHWKKVCDRIDTRETLKQHLVEKYPLNAYYTVSSWLNPSVLGEKGEDVARNGFMFSDYVLDIDTTDKEAVRTAWNTLKALGYEDLSLRFTGGGYHIVIRDWFRSETPDPRQREEECLGRMQRFTEELVDRGLEFDYNYWEGELKSVSIDTRRIIKLPGTVTKYGNVAEHLEHGKLDKFKPRDVIPIQLREPVQAEEIGRFFQQVGQI